MAIDNQFNSLLKEMSLYFEYISVMPSPPARADVQKQCFMGGELILLRHGDTF